MTAPRVLYHYTTQAGLLGILTSRSIWATQIQFLNDSTEFVAGLEIAAGHLKAMAQLSKAGVNPVAHALSKQLRLIANIRVCVVSLTEEGDQLSQWRAYSGSHSGFAVAFDTTKLAAIATNHGFSLQKCIYADHTKRDHVTHVFSEYFGLRAKAGPPDFAYAMVKTAPLLKHEGFAEEREWRLVSDVLTQEMHFRSGLSTITPYYPLPLTSPDASSCVSGVVIGPTPHPDLAMEAVHSLAESRGLGGIAITASKIPLRTW